MGFSRGDLHLLLPSIQGTTSSGALSVIFKACTFGGFPEDVNFVYKILLGQSCDFSFSGIALLFFSPNTLCLVTFIAILTVP